MKNTKTICFLLSLSVSLLSIGFTNNLNAQTKTTVKQIEYETKTIKVNDDDFAYRIVENNSNTNIPIILLNHTRGNLDNWDPALINKLASERTVITFNNRGVASSSGQTPASFAQMAEDAFQFIKALKYEKVDILGFSIGGCVAQELLMQHQDIVRKAVIAGTAPLGARSINKRDPEIAALVQRSSTLGLKEFQALFFNASDNSRKLGEDFWNRKAESKYPKDVEVGTESAKAQAIARENWGNGELIVSDYKKITTPILVTGGKTDVQMPVQNSMELFNLLPNAQLILYPDAGHGFLFQYYDLFGGDVNRFLNSK